MLKTVSSIVNAIGALNFKGTWDANANSPALASSVGTKGDYYVVGTAGSTNLNGISNWGVGDLATFNGSVWQRVEGGADLNGVNLSVSGTSTLSGLTASTALALNASKEIVSVTNTGTGDNVLATSPTLVTPALGAATATSINKVALTAPATASTLTIADGKTLTANNSLTLSGTDATTMTFPTTSATIARTDSGQTFSGAQIFSFTGGANAPVLNRVDGAGVLKFNQSNGTAGLEIGTNGSGGFSVYTALSGATLLGLDITAAGVARMSFYGAGSATFSATGVISSVSDERWKRKDGVPTNPVEMLKGLQPGYWYYNDEKSETFGTERQLGFYAQNVNAAIGPEAAPEPEEGKSWGYYDRSVLAVTVMALQDALKRIETLEEQLKGV